MKNFMNDDDGFSSKDYLLVISTLIFFTFIVIGLILTLNGKPIDDTYLSLLDMVTPVVMTVVGGVCGVQAVQVFSERRNVKMNQGTFEQTNSQQYQTPTYQQYQNYPQQYQETYPIEQSQFIGRG